MSTDKSSTRAACLAALFVPLMLASTGASALPTINLTDDTYNGVAATTSGVISNTMGTVKFQVDSTQPAGTGVFNPFLRLDVKGNGSEEQGYNTSATITENGHGNTVTTRKVLDNMSPVNWTHDVLISSLALTADNLYYQFKLDINEPGADKASLLSLDGLMLFSTSIASQSGEKLDNKGDIFNGNNGIVGTKLWDMDADADSSVLLDAKRGGTGPGSGVADMMMLVDRAVIDRVAGNGEQYLVLWSRFGLSQGAGANTALTTADAGFEEWSYSGKTGNGNCTTNCGGGTVPSPGTVPLALLALGVLGYQRHTRKTRLVAS